MTELPRASARDSAGVLADVLLPLLARGVIVRRPRVVGVLGRMDADRRAVRRLQRLRARYGEGPLRLLASLRADANWSFMKPQRRRMREEFLLRLAGYVDRAEPGSLVSVVASTPASPQTYPVEQVPQWLFAFDAAGMAAFRTLALLDAHGEVAERARAEVAAADLTEAPELPLLRASMLESLRLWPTTPAVLRDTTADTEWQNGTLRAGAGLVIFAPFFHRDGEQLAFADSFDPELWADGRTAQDWPLIPFSAGPAQCPGRNVVLLTSSLLLANLLSARPRQAARVALDRARPMPATLSPFHLRFEVSAS